MPRSIKNIIRENYVCDVVVIGGGPAGMMAALAAAAEGAQVILLEKNSILGKKLSITGGGRCNVTNNKPRVREVLSQYSSAGKFLFSTFTQHGVAETVTWFLERGVPFKEENEGRLFPQTDSAETICQTLVEEMLKQKVEVRLRQAASRITYNKKTKEFTVETSGGVVKARACVVATGGYARPDTGSNGEGFLWLKKLGHSIHAHSDALVPIALKTKWTKSLSGLTLSEVRVSVWADGKKHHSKTGRILFTHFGITGPLILNMSKQVGDLIETALVELRLDLFPNYEAGKLREYFKTVLASNKKLQNALAEILPAQLVKVLLIQLAIAGDTPCHSVSSADRKKLLQYIKSVPLPVLGLLGADKAIVSSGGVSLEEIDFRSMSSKIIPNLYLVGDVLNVNRPSGGYSLQLCWSTGFVAGKHAGLDS